MAAVPTVTETIGKMNSWSQEAKSILALKDEEVAADKTDRFRKQLRDEMIGMLDSKVKQKYEQDPQYQTIIEFFLSTMNRSPAVIQSDNYKKFLFNVQDFSIIAVNRLNLMKEGKGILLF